MKRLTNSTTAPFNFHHLTTIALVTLTLVAFLFLALQNTASAQSPNPPNQPARGLVYDGLTPSQRADCPNGFLIRVPGQKKPLCTPGPDATPFGSAESTTAPLAESITAAQVVCDGDGTSGKRIQVIYVRAADQPDRYAQYVNSIQQWAAGADDIFNQSAAETGGERHVRFVHDGSCLPVVENLVLSATGDDNFGNTVTELRALGYNYADRNYLLFVDSPVYCGIANMVGDDTPGVTNQNNIGSRYARVDTRCWGAWAAAHEMMHTLGGVQMSAPHTTNAWHCTDDYDVMCYQDSATAPAMQYLCDSTHEMLFDCNHDDYYSTNPARRSYLATHWNVANSQFLFDPADPLAVNSIVTGKVASGVFTQTDTFKPGNKVNLQIRVVDANGKGIGNVQANVNVKQPNGTTVCNLTATSDSTGLVQSACALPKNAALGNWQIQVTNLAKTGGYFAADENAQSTFTVIAK